MADYLKYFNKPIDVTIRKRISCRTFADRLIDEKDKEELLTFCQIINTGLRDEKVTYHLAEFGIEALRDRKISAYGLIRNARSFVFGIIDKSDSHNVSYGYAMEHLVLKATELGIGTCWAGYFDPYVTQDVQVHENQAIPAVVIVGYAAETKTIREKVARLAIGASRRHNWQKIFFHGRFDKTLASEAAGPYSEALELLRFAPSSGNTQPWRIVKEKNHNTFHFYKKVINPGYEKKKLHDMDIGIAMCHFELGAEKNGLKGHWVREDPRITPLPDRMHYMISWMQG
ncbi:MAG: nitroreductase family protein [candidate division WOR-3 bacterium]|nr:MAG: nitroreductase family protein [candidate division WOR-3 bacterium]